MFQDSLQVECRLVVATFLLVAVVSRLMSHHDERVAVASYGVPERIASPLAALLPALEIALGVCLLLGVALGLVASFAIGLLLLYAVAATRLIVLGRRQDCHCFGGTLRQRLGPEMVARNVVLAGALFPLAFAAQPALALGGSTTAGLSATDYLPLELSALAIVLGYLQTIRALGLEVGPPDELAASASKSGAQ